MRSAPVARDDILYLSVLPLLLTNLTATLLLTAIAWSLQFVQLPLLRPEDAPRHRRLNTRLVILPMLAEALATLSLLGAFPSTAVLALTALWIAAALATAGYTRQHSRAFDRRALARWNLLRALAWTARVVLLLSIII